VMGRKGKTALFVIGLLVLSLGLYRNFGVPLLKFWPLILIDVLLRFPGDNILKLLNPHVPAVAYEVLRALFQIATGLFLWLIIRKCRGSHSDWTQGEGHAVSQKNATRDRLKGTYKKKLAAALCVVLGIYFVGVRGRQTVWLASSLFAVYPYPLYVTTEVFMEGSEHKLDVHYFMGNRPESRDVLPSGYARMSGATDFQQNLLIGHRIIAPLLRPGIILERQLPPGISHEDVELVERLALDFLNAFEDLGWEYRADADLIFSRDGARATFRINIYSYDGPLAAAGSLYAVELAKIGKHWLVTNFGSTGFWLS